MSEKNNDPSVEEIMQNGAKYPERASEDLSDRNPAEGIYAGPVVMMTYAGPDMMNKGIGVMASGFGQPAIQPASPPAPKQPDDPDSVKCEMCGNYCSKGAKFCPECGHPLGGN